MTDRTLQRTPHATPQARTLPAAWCSVAVALTLAGCGGGAGSGDEAAPASGLAARPQAAGSTVLMATAPSVAVAAPAPLVPMAAPLAAPLPPAAAELRFSDTFESGLARWADWGNAQLIAGAGASGSTALRVGLAAGGAGATVTGIVPGSTYQLTAQVRVTDPSEVAYVGINFLNSSGAVVGQKALAVSATAYTQASIEMAAPANASFAVVFVWKNAGAGFVLLDDVTLSRVTDPPAPPPAPGNPANMLSNPGFESGMTSWVNWSNSLVVEGEGAAGSTRALRVGPGSGGAAQEVPGIVPGAQYRLSAQVRASDASGTGFLAADVVDANGAVYHYLATVSSTTWTQAAVQVPTTSTTVRVIVYVWKNEGSGFLYLDDVVFTRADGTVPPPAPAPSPAPSNVVVNPGFEENLASWVNWGNATVVPESASGAFALRVGTAAGGVGQTITGFTAGTKYTFSAQARVAAPGEVVYVGLKFFDASGATVLEQVLALDAASYGSGRVDVVVPASATRGLVFVWKNAGSAYAYVDDVSLVSAPSSDPSGAGDWDY